MATQWQVSEPEVLGISAGDSRLQEVISLYAVLAAEDCGRQSTTWDRVLGLVTMVVVSASGWALIIALLFR
jgi:hypothetical protein